MINPTRDVVSASRNVLVAAVAALALACGGMEEVGAPGAPADSGDTDADPGLDASVTTDGASCPCDVFATAPGQAAACEVCLQAKCSGALAGCTSAVDGACSSSTTALSQCATSECPDCAGCASDPAVPCMGAFGYACASDATPDLGVTTQSCSVPTAGSGESDYYCCFDWTFAGTQDCAPITTTQCPAGSYGFECNGLAAPNAIDTDLSCSPAMQGPGGASDYCCVYQ